MIQDEKAREKALEQQMNDMERALFFGEDYKEQWRVHVHKTTPPGPSRLERTLAESKPVEPHDFQWLGNYEPGESRDRPERVDLPPTLVCRYDMLINFTDAPQD